MDDREQERRQRAYKLWEDEGRPHGSHDHHWHQAGDQHELTEQASEDVTEANQIADDPIAASKEKPKRSSAKR